MKERKIIVNKCDVSGCEFYCRYTDNCLDYKHWYDKPLCKNLPDCHYKQLKRKEQECEELKHQLEDVDTLVNEKESLIDKCLQTLTDIKEIAEKQCVCGVDCIDMKQILQKISEVENG